MKWFSWVSPHCVLFSLQFFINTTFTTPTHSRLPLLSATARKYLLQKWLTPHRLRLLFPLIPSSTLLLLLLLLLVRATTRRPLCHQTIFGDDGRRLKTISSKHTNFGADEKWTDGFDVTTTTCYGSGDYCVYRQHYFNYKCAVSLGKAKFRRNVRVFVLVLLHRVC